jgi:hypothetical protein
MTKRIPPKPTKVASFGPADMSEREARTNSADSFAAIREVDTRQVSRNDLRRLMSERFRSAA